MKVILFGASGMVGQGVLRESLLDPDVTSIISIGRSPVPQKDPKLEQIAHADFSDFSSLTTRLAGYDACFFCLGVSSLGLKESVYRHLTYDFALAAGRLLAKINPAMTFIYVSGMGTDSTERGKVMWARVKGATENALLALPFKGYMFRPAMIIPLHGIRSKTPLYQIPLTLMGWMLPLFKSRFPKYITTTEQVGRAMLNTAKTGAPRRILESADINTLTTI